MSDALKSDNLPPAIMLMGPTASGKTALSLFLADQLPLEIISVDSALVYQGMDIGTSKPDQQTLQQYPHHLINISSPADAYSVAQFRQDALQAMADITQRGKIPLLVGGTMLYFRGLIQGLSELPSADANVRKALDDFVSVKGLKALHERLQDVDPEAAQKIHPNDPQRVQRALEVYEISGKPISQWWKEQQANKLPYLDVKLCVSTAERSLLHQRIETRFEQMLGAGLIEEVETLRARGDLDLNKPSMRAVGYRQVWQYLDGDYTYDEMKYKGVVATRQLAKRQLTWLRSEQALHWFNSNEKNFEQQVLKLIHQVPSLNS